MLAIVEARNMRPDAGVRDQSLTRPALNVTPLWWNAKTAGGSSLRSTMRSSERTIFLVGRT